MLATLPLSDPGRGHICAFIGPMFSGKTGEMLCMLNRFDYVKNSLVVLFKFARDNRDGDDMVKSRDGISRISTARVMNCGEIQELIVEEAESSIENIIVVGIDEAQFISGMADFAEWVSGKRDTLLDKTIIVYVSALDSDSEKRMWKEIVELIPHCDQVTKMTAICGDCGLRPAPLTRRDIATKELIVIGSKDIYTATCSVCHNKK